MTKNQCVISHIGTPFHHTWTLRWNMNIKVEGTQTGKLTKWWLVSKCMLLSNKICFWPSCTRFWKILQHLLFRHGWIWIIWEALEVSESRRQRLNWVWGRWHLTVTRKIPVKFEGNCPVWHATQHYQHQLSVWNSGPTKLLPYSLKEDISACKYLMIGIL